MKQCNLCNHNSLTSRADKRTNGKQTDGLSEQYLFVCWCRWSAICRFCRWCCSCWHSQLDLSKYTQN